MIARFLRMTWTLGVLAAALSLAAPALGWTPLTVTGACNENGTLWTVTASHSEANLNVDFSYDAAFTVVLDTFELSGSPLTTSYLGGPTEAHMWVRWSGDHSVVTEGSFYGTCQDPTPTPSPSPTPTGTPVPTATPTATATATATLTEPTPTPTSTGTPTPTSTAGTPSTTPAPTPPVTLPPTATSGGPTSPTDSTGSVLDALALIVFVALVGTFLLAPNGRRRRS